MENAQQNNLVGQIVRPGVVSGFQNDENAQPGVVYGFRTVGDYGCYSDGLGAMYIFGRTKARAMVEYENEIEGQLEAGGPPPEPTAEPQAQLPSLGRLQTRSTNPVRPRNALAPRSPKCSLETQKRRAPPPCAPSWGR